MSAKTRRKAHRKQQLPDGTYWCPTENRTMWCPGPCPDGTLHETEIPRA